MVSRNIVSVLPPIAILVVAVSVYFLPMNNSVKGFLLAILPTISTTYTLLSSKFAVTNHYIYFLSIGMIALYFESRLIIAYAISLNGIMIITYFLNSVSLLGDNSNIIYLVTTLIMLNGVFVLLYFLTRWGKELVYNSIESSN